MKTLITAFFLLVFMSFQTLTGHSQSIVKILDDIATSGAPGLGSVRSGHLTDSNHPGFNVTEPNAQATLNPLTIPEGAGTFTIGGIPAFRFIFASYITGVTTTAPLPVGVLTKTLFLDIDTAVNKVNPFGATGSIQLFGHSNRQAENIHNVTTGWKPLRYVKRDSLRKAAIMEASTETLTVADETGYIFSATGAYEIDVRGLRWYMIAAEDLGSITATISATLSSD